MPFQWDRWQTVTAMLATAFFAVGSLLPIGSGFLMGVRPGFGSAPAPVDAYAWAVVAPQEARAWYGLDLPTVAHAVAFTLWWLAMVLLAGSAIRALPDPQRRLIWLAAGGAIASSALLHMAGMRLWLLEVRPGLGLAFQVAAGVGWIVLSLRPAAVAVSSAPNGRRTNLPRDEGEANSGNRTWAVQGGAPITLVLAARTDARARLTAASPPSPPGPRLAARTDARATLTAASPPSPL